MDDVVVIGAGPAGAVAAAVLARAGVRGRLLDRAAFSREELRVDSVNPGAVALVRLVSLARAIVDPSLPIGGMIVTGEGGTAVASAYPRGQHGIALSRRQLDAILVRQSVAAGAVFDCGVVVREAIVDAGAVRGVVVSANGASHQLRAPVVIAADGRRSALAFGLRLARHPQDRKST